MITHLSSEAEIGAMFDSCLERVVRWCQKPKMEVLPVVTTTDRYPLCTVEGHYDMELIQGIIPWVDNRTGATFFSFITKGRTGHSSIVPVYYWQTIGSFGFISWVSATNHDTLNREECYQIFTSHSILRFAQRFKKKQLTPFEALTYAASTTMHMMFGHHECKDKPGRECWEGVCQDGVFRGEADGGKVVFKSFLPWDELSKRDFEDAASLYNPNAYIFGLPTVDYDEIHHLS